MTASPAPLTAERLNYLSLIREIEDFFYLEADLLDARDYQAWLDFFAEDVRYHVPMRKNLAFRDRDHDVTADDDIAWFDDDKDTLIKRVEQILTGVHWAEEPVSRVSHLVSNIRLTKPCHSLGMDEAIEVRCHFLVHRNRLEYETDFLAGRRIDLIRRTTDGLRIARRTIIIDQSVLLAKNLSFFL